MELISLLTMAKQTGLDVGNLISLITIYFMLKRFVTNQNKEVRDVVTSQVDKIVLAIGRHNERLDNLETDVREIKMKLYKE